MLFSVNCQILVCDIINILTTAQQTCNTLSLIYSLTLFLSLTLSHHLSFSPSLSLSALLSIFQSSSHLFSPYTYNSLPENSIRDFIVYEVLTQYTFLFNQIEENSGPEGKQILLFMDIFNCLLALSLLISLSLTLNLSLSLAISLSLSFSLSLSSYLSHSHSLPLSLSLTPTLFLSLFTHFPLSLSLCFSLSLFLSHFPTLYCLFFLGSDLQEWIQNMLFTMQDSIETHVQAAMNDAP